MFRILLLAAALLPLPATAQEYRFKAEEGFSTMGYYLAPGYRVNERVGLRVPLYTDIGGLDMDLDIEGNTLSGTGTSRSFGLFADYHPTGGAFRLTGGLAIGGYKYEGTMTDPTYNGVTYSGTATITSRQSENLAPVVAMGFAKTIGESRFQIVGELGAKLTTYEISSSGISDPDYDAEIDRINSDLKDFWATPYLTFGASFQF